MDSDFGHTWDEGLEACQNAEKSSLPKTGEVIRMLIKQIPLFQKIIAVQNKTDHSAVDDAYDTPEADSRSCTQLSPTVMVPILLIVFLRMLTLLQ